MIARPYLLRRLRELGVIGDPGEQALVRDGIVTLPDFELAVAEGRTPVADPGIQGAVAGLIKGQRPLTLGRAWEIMEPLTRVLAAQCAGLEAIEPSGAMRRFEPLVSSLVVVGRAAQPARALDAAAAQPGISDILYRTDRRMIVVVEGQEIDIRVTAADEYGSLLFTTTGPADHVAAVHKRRGPRLSASEVDVYTKAGLGYLAPESRTWPDAVEIALHHAVPPLVVREDIRGDLHMHTTRSDGRDTLRSMVMACHALGYEYIAITDHSEHAGAARTLTLDSLERQRDEIAQLRLDVPGLTIFHGIEVDMLPSGGLDCPDRILASLDIVLASLHEAAGQNRRQLTRRCLDAIRNPLVSVITHPMNQLVGRRASYDMDYAALYDAAAETGTALEVDGAPTHLDLDGPHACEAIRAGVMLVLDSDCHRMRSLDRQMRMAVGTARRGRVEPRHVLNARPVEDVRAFIDRKRRLG